MDELRLTAEFRAMTALQKWDTLTLQGLLGTNEPWIADIREHLKRDAARIATQRALPADVVRLVIAARKVAYTDTPTQDEKDGLDRAVGAFASRVPWDDEPERE